MSISPEQVANVSSGAAPRGSKRAIAYVVRHEGLTSVFQSQVLERMAQFAGDGYHVDVMVLTPLGQLLRPVFRRKWQDLLAGAPLPLRGHIKRIPSPPSRFKSLAFDTWMLSWALSRWAKQHGPNAIVYCRNAIATFSALEVRQRMKLRFPVIYDCRGLEDEETVFVPGSPEGAAPSEDGAKDDLTNVMRMVAQNADAMVCVSQAMVDYMAERFHVSPDKCLMIPCCVDITTFCRAHASRDQIRRQLGFDDAFVVAYCGSLAKWQMPELSLRLFKVISELDARARFLALTTAPERMTSLARALGVLEHQAKITCIPHSQIPHYLAAADVGLLLRQNSIVNKVASPVKFGEYLASGTPIILTPYVGDYSRLVEHERLGVVLKDASDGASATAHLARFVDDYRKNGTTLRQRCVDVAKRILTIHNYLPQFANMIDTCLGNRQKPE